VALESSASMEPLFFKAENGRTLRMFRRGRLEASMEPLFFKAENLPGCQWRLPTGWMASMEPLFFKAENALCPVSLSSGPAASMEPLFFKAENGRVNLHCWCAFGPLQWSRFFSKRKILGTSLS